MATPYAQKPVRVAGCSTVFTTNYPFGGPSCRKLSFLHSPVKARVRFCPRLSFLLSLLLYTSNFSQRLAVT